MSAAVEELAGKAEALSTTAGELQALVARFRLSRDDEDESAGPIIPRRRAEDWRGPRPAGVVRAR
jgi:hypothetical protein